MFTVVALYKTLSGERSCGCFGAIDVHPGITLMLDITILALLVFALRAEAQGASVGGAALFPDRRWIAMGAAVVVPVLVLSSRPTRATMNESGMIADRAKIIILEPAAWLNRPFPLTRHIDIGSQLTTGTRTVVLHRHDCPECRRALPAFEAKAREGASIALIEVPPHASQVERLNPACLHGRLSDRREWFVQTPTVIELQNGIVVSVFSPPH